MQLLSFTAKDPWDHVHVAAHVALANKFIAGEDPRPTTLRTRANGFLTATTSQFLVLDFETWSPVDLPATGAPKYIEHPEFRVLSASASISTGGVPPLPDYEEDFRIQYNIATGDQPDTIDLYGKHLKRFFTEIFHALAMSNYPVYLVAHNAAFEQMILRRVAPELNRVLSGVIDTAALSRINGGSGRLAIASKQFLPASAQKFDTGASVIQKLAKCPDTDTMLEVLKELVRSGEWGTFLTYGDQDVNSCIGLLETLGTFESLGKLMEDYAITDQMNTVGWPVDMKAAHFFQEQHARNTKKILKEVQWTDYAKDLNLMSPVQIVDFFKARRIRLTSTDEAHMLQVIEKIEKELERLDQLPSLTPAEEVRVERYSECLHIAYLKRELGGSAVAKISKILNSVSADGRLRGQYVHVGAGASHRTSGAGVQLQNLKRLPKNSLSEEFLDTRGPASTSTPELTNARLGENIRQLFGYRAEDKRQLIVADYKSIESRLLAYLAGATWKLDAFRDGRDPYVIQAEHMYHVDYDSVTPEQRQGGKVGELGCGYQAGPDAIVSFATGYGMKLTPAEARDIVVSWRTLNKEVVDFWQVLQDLLEGAIVSGTTSTWRVDRYGGQLEISMTRRPMPQGIPDIPPGAYNLDVTVSISRQHEKILSYQRTFPGVYQHGRDFRYFKPREAKTGPVWTDRWTDPKTQQVRYHTLYGGKLAGILTQSLAREIFFLQMGEISKDLDPDTYLIGQFHDELVIDAPVWKVSSLESYLKSVMASDDFIPGLPMEVSVGASARYRK